MTIDPQWNCFCDLCMAEAVQEANEWADQVEEDFWTWEMDEV